MLNEKINSEHADNLEIQYNGVNIRWGVYLFFVFAFLISIFDEKVLVVRLV